MTATVTAYIPRTETVSTVLVIWPFGRMAQWVCRPHTLLRPPRALGSTQGSGEFFTALNLRQEPHSGSKSALNPSQEPL